LALNLLQGISVNNLLKIAIAGLIFTTAEPLFAQTGTIPVSVNWTKNQAGKHQSNVPVVFHLFDSRNNRIAVATVLSNSGRAIHRFTVPVNIGRGSSVASTVYYVKAFVYGKALSVSKISHQPLQDKWTVVFLINSKGKFQGDASKSTNHGPTAQINIKENIYRMNEGYYLQK
jgi:hypothetical protein